MTKEEAVNLLRANVMVACDTSDKVGYGTPLNKAIEEALNMVINALEQEPKWISVSERIPEPNRLVLCHITTGATETYFLALWNDTLNAWEEGIGGYRLLENDLGYEVIEWMPLPKFYKAESEE